MAARSLRSIASAAVGIVLAGTLVVGPPPAAATAAPLPILVPGSASVLEANTGITLIQVPVTLSTPSSETVTANWSTRFVSSRAPAGQADPGTDYEAASGVVTFAPGDTEATATITVNGDTTVEPDEWIAVAFTGAVNAQLGGFYGLGFGGIRNDDRLATIIPGTISSLEGDSGITTVQIPVTLDAPSNSVVSASWTGVFIPGAPPNQATPTIDFLQAAGSVTFQPGETSATIELQIVGDTIDEPDEYVVVIVDNPINAKMGGFYGLALGGILDDDPPAS